MKIKVVFAYNNYLDKENLDRRISMSIISALQETRKMYVTKLADSKPEVASSIKFYGNSVTIYGGENKIREYEERIKELECQIEVMSQVGA